MLGRTPQPLSSHLWILTQLTELTYNNHSVLMRYIIGACHAKMNRRLQTDFSLGYMHSLMQVKDFTFNDSHRPFNANEQALDGNFLETFIPIYRSCDGLFPLQIPNILAVHARFDAHEPWQLYNQNTCLEFRDVFQCLLDRFASTLKTLVVEMSRSTKIPGRIQGFIGMIFLVGDMLTKLARGDALKRYLENIENLLVDQRGTGDEIQGQVPGMATPSEDNTVASTSPEDDAVTSMPPEDDAVTSTPEDANEEGDLDPDVQVLRMVAPKGTVQNKRENYLDWLQLMVAHFDAVDIVLRFLARSQTRTININILVSPRVTEEYLPWKTLFAETSSFIPKDRRSTISNKDILEYLTTSHGVDKNDSRLLSDIKTIIKYFVNMEEATEKHRSRSFTLAKRQLTTLLSVPPNVFLSKDWSDTITTTQSAITSYEDAKSTDKERAEALARIREGFNSLFKQYGELVSTRKLPFTLEPSNKFLGSLHCESALASILDYQSRKEMEKDDCCKSILEQTKVIFFCLGLIFVVRSLFL